MANCKHYFSGDSFVEDEKGELIETCQFCGEKES